MEAELGGESWGRENCFPLLSFLCGFQSFRLFQEQGLLHGPQEMSTLTLTHHSVALVLWDILEEGVCSSSSFFNMSPVILPIPSEHPAIPCVSASLTLLPKHLQAKCQAQTGLLMPISSAIIWTQLIGWAGPSHSLSEAC